MTEQALEQAHGLTAEQAALLAKIRLADDLYGFGCHLGSPGTT